MESADTGRNFAFSAMPYSEDKQAYIEKVQEFLKINDLVSNEDWNVYAFVKLSGGRHAGLRFESIDELKSFAIELFVDQEKKPKEMFMGLSVMDQKRLSKNKKIPLGQIQKQAIEIFDTAYDVMKKMGTYYFFTNNCQDYAQQLAIALGVPKKFKTDIDKLSECDLAKLQMTVGYYKDLSSSIRARL